LRIAADDLRERIGRADGSRREARVWRRDGRRWGASGGFRSRRGGINRVFIETHSRTNEPTPRAAAIPNPPSTPELNDETFTY